MKKLFTYTRSWLNSLVIAGLTISVPAAVQAQDFPEPYCDVTFAWNVEPITIVEFAGIENITDAEIDGTPALEDFTDMTATVLPGFAFEITLDGNTGGDYNNYFFVYADWNQDGDFDDEYEANYAGSIFWSDGDGIAPATSLIPVPPTALPGVTRLRVLKIYDSSVPDDPGACSSPYDFGQAEDYSVEVLELDCEFPEITYTVTPDCDDNEFSISFDVADMGDATSIEVMEGTTSVHTFTGIGTFNVGPFASGTSHTYTFVHSGSEDCSLIAEDITYSCPPLNDECSNATSIAISEGNACTEALSGTTGTATASMLEACGGYADDDVWYSFEATETTLGVSITPTGGTTEDMMFEIFDVCDGEYLLCSDPEVQTITGFEVGTTYLIRVYTWEEGTYADFDICINTLPEGAICDEALTVTTIPYTDEGNTADYGNVYGGGPGSSCSEYDYLSGNDVVYSYTAATTGTINVELIPTDVYAGVFIYTSCDDIGVTCAGGGVNEDSSDPININDFAVTSGETYYFVISTWASPYTTEYTFNITEGASCVAPTALEATSFTSSTATVAWTSSEDNFELEWGEEGFTLGSGTTETGIATTSYTIDGLSESTSYSFYVKTICSATEESTWAGPFTFTVPGPGWTCDNPLEVTDLPYTTDDNTENYGDAFSGSPGIGCGSTFSYLSGYDVVYSYTPASSGSINAELIPEDIYAGLFIYTSCDDIGVACVDGGVNEDSADPINIDDFVVTAGETYYFVISTWAEPLSTAYTFNITENVVEVTGIDAHTEDFVPAIINVDGGTLAMASSITPLTADQSVNWSIVSAGGNATISTTGLVTAISNGIVYAKATSVADPSFRDSVLITISNQEVAAIGVDVTVESGGAAIINTAGGTLQMAAAVLPSTADQDVNWSIVEGTGEATISPAGLVTAAANGSVWAKAVAASDGTLADSLLITITNQETGIDEVIKALGFAIHPNPTHNAVNLSMTSSHPNLSIVVTDINGRHLANYAVPANGLNKGLKIELDKFAAGIYLVTVSGNEIHFSSKIVKQ